MHGYFRCRALLSTRDVQARIFEWSIYVDMVTLRQSRNSTLTVTDNVQTIGIGSVMFCVSDVVQNTDAYFVVLITVIL